MDIDYLTCNYCGDTFPDCMSYTTCNEDCCNIWCNATCANKEGWRQDNDDDVDKDDEEYSCKYCRNEDLDDTTLAKFLLKRCGLTRKQAVKEFNDKSKSKKNKK